MSSEIWWVTLTIGVIRLIVYLYEYLTFPLYYLFSKTLRYLPLPNAPFQSDYTYNEEESRTLAIPVDITDPGSNWRAVESLHQLTTTAVPSCKDLVNMWLRTVNLWPETPAFGTRAVLGTEYREMPDGRRMVELILGDYSWESYSDAERRISRIAAGLYSMLGSTANEDPIVPIAIFSETRAEWFFAAHALFRLRRPVVTLYSTLGDENLIHGINESATKIVFTSDELLSRVVKTVKHCPTVERVIYFTNGVFSNELYSNVDLMAVQTGSAVASIADAIVNVPSTLHLHDLIEVERRGGAIIMAEAEKERKETTNGSSNDSGNNGKPPTAVSQWMPPNERVDPSDLAVIMYTSGSTGNPKGVELPHSCMVSAIAGHLQRLPKMRSTYDIYIGYLPLAHVLELTCELACVIMGVRIGYSNPQTLTDTSTRIKRGACSGDLMALSPTVFTSVPVVLERISKAVWEKVNSSGPFFKALFRFAYNYKCRRLHGGFPSFLADKLIFRKMRALMGGRVRYIVSGGAPLSEDSHLFTNICMAPLIQGYGLTETSSAGALMECGDLRCNHVGSVAPSCQIRLRPWAEGGYSPMDQPSPRGEIIISGGPVARGYYKQPELTSRDFFRDETDCWWFCTGDIGLLHTDGSLSIIDRKKDLVKLQMGEYLSLSKIELALSQSAYVEQICVYADSSQNFALCFVSPKYNAFMDLADSLDLTGLVEAARSKFTETELANPTVKHQTDLEALHEHPKVIENVLADLKRVGKEKRLATFEIPQKLYIDTITWTPDTELVTEALKLKRFNLQTRFQPQIAKLYGYKSSS